MIITMTKKRKTLMIKSFSLYVSLSLSHSHTNKCTLKTLNVFNSGKKNCVVLNLTLSSQDDLLESEEEFDSDSESDVGKGI
jgi:hypothetical protein